MYSMWFSLTFIYWVFITKRSYISHLRDLYIIKTFYQYHHTNFYVVSLESFIFIVFIHCWHHRTIILDYVHKKITNYTSMCRPPFKQCYYWRSVWVWEPPFTVCPYFLTTEPDSKVLASLPSPAFSPARQWERLQTLLLYTYESLHARVSAVSIYMVYCTPLRVGVCKHREDVVTVWCYWYLWDLDIVCSFLSLSLLAVSDTMSLFTRF